jgi:regulator of protease activity HflC (stomatin/prohibitin superfamily)
MPFLPVIVVVVILALYAINCVKILKEYERAVVYTFGRVGNPAGPGLIFILAPAQTMTRVSLRQEAMEVPPQDIITRDNVTLKVNAVITFYVMNPVDAVIKVSNYIYQTSQFAQTTLRTVLGEVDLDQLLEQRERLNQRIQTIIDGHTAPFGVKVVSVEVKQIDLPDSMLRSMAKQAEAERERKAKIIHAEGEFDAARKLVDAAALMATEPMTLQLRYLQTLTEIGVEKNTTIIFPLPMELMNLLNRTLAQPPAARVDLPKTDWQ